MPDELLISTRDRPGAYDAIETAKPGEPLFPIQGGDPFGPATVLYWASLARKAGLEEADEKAADALLRKASGAEHVAWAMQAYQRGEAAVQPAKRASYQEDAAREAAEALAGGDQRVALAHGAGRLHNSVAESILIAESLARMRVHPEAEVQIREAVALLKEAAFAIEPRRHLRRS